MKARVSKVLLVLEDKVVGRGQSEGSETLSEKVYEGLGSEAMQRSAKANEGDRKSYSKSINLNSEERWGNSGPNSLCFAVYYKPVIIVATRNAKKRHQQMAEAKVWR